jgi:hypothetical protein
MEKRNQTFENNSKGLVPSYILQGDKGKEIAKLKGMQKGWLYPTSIINFIQRPAILLLFDKIIIDSDAAKEAERFLQDKIQRLLFPTDSESEYSCYAGSHYENSQIEKELTPLNKEQAKRMLDDLQKVQKLLESEIFIQKSTESELTWQDVNRIKDGFNNDHHNVDFEQAVKSIEEVYGYNYASPNPIDFEAMNINIIESVSKKYGGIPIDDCVKAKLYRYKLISSYSKYEKTAEQYIDNLPQVIYGLPNIEINNVNEFIEFHQNKRIKDFREHVKDMTDSVSESEFNQKIKNDLYRSNKQLQELKFDTFSFIGSVMGLTGSSIALALSTTNPWIFAGSYLAFASSLTGTFNQLENYWEKKKLNWFDFLKGLAESQA